MKNLAKRKVLSLVLVVAVCLGFAMPAAGDDDEWIVTHRPEDGPYVALEAGSGWSQNLEDFAATRVSLESDEIITIEYEYIFESDVINVAEGTRLIVDFKRGVDTEEGRFRHYLEEAYVNLYYSDGTVSVLEDEWVDEHGETHIYVWAYINFDEDEEFITLLEFDREKGGLITGSDKIVYVLDTPGYYRVVSGVNSFVSGSNGMASPSFTTIKVGSGAPDSDQPEEAPAAKTARPTSSRVLVNGEETAFDAYLIDGNNYFKLRDLAHALNGTDKQFEVGWDGEANAISLTSGEAYTPVGGEMEISGGTETRTATPTTSAIYLDGELVQFTAYLIGGNNYFKLRDIMQAFDVYVGWNGETNTITLDTTKSYTN